MAVKFNVTTEAIIALNGIDPDSGKRIRSVLIPDSAYMQEFNAGRIPEDGEPGTDREERTARHAEGLAPAEESVPAETAVREWEVIPDPSGTERRITLVLPFNASRLTGSLNAYTADFYAGAMIAAADLKERGLFSNFYLNVIDINRYGSAWELVADNALSGSDLIIGPISERDMQPIASWARSRRVPVVSPLDLKTASLLQDNPCLYLFPPQSDLALGHQLDKIEEASRNSDTTGSVTVIYEQGYERSDLVLQTMSGLAERGIAFKTFKYDFLSGRGIDSLMSLSLDTVLVNRVIIPSMSEAFITDALRNLSLIQSSRGYIIDVYGLSRWKSFETVEQDYFHALDLRLAILRIPGIRHHDILRGGHERPGQGLPGRHSPGKEEPSAVGRDVRGGQSGFRLPEHGVQGHLLHLGVESPQRIMKEGPPQDECDGPSCFSDAGEPT